MLTPTAKTNEPERLGLGVLCGVLQVTATPQKSILCRRGRPSATAAVGSASQPALWRPGGPAWRGCQRPRGRAGGRATGRRAAADPGAENGTRGEAGWTLPPSTPAYRGGLARQAANV